ncbi:MAG: DHH family phosphoesterase [Bacteroidota bacterium]
MHNLQELKEFLSTPRKVAIVSHRNPDGDAIGSTLGLFHYLSRKRHDATVAVPSDYPFILDFLPGADYILIHDRKGEETDKMIQEADIVFCLDFNALHRIDKMGETIAGTSVPKVLIDHHLFPEDFADYNLSDTSASSTCELVFDFIEMLGDKSVIDDIIGECLYAGILTDTGSFKYATSAKLFRIAAELHEVGVDDVKLQNYLFNSHTIKQIRLLGYCLTRGMHLFPEFKTGFIVLSREQYKRFNIKRGDTEGIVNYLLKMRSINFAVLITERDQLVKLSFRSKGDFDVQQMASSYFNGGGHKNASGGISHRSLDDTVDYLKSLLPAYKQKLENA